MFSFTLFNKNHKKTKGGKKEEKIILQLGDVIQVFDGENNSLNNQTFVIDYIDSDKIKLINTEQLNQIVLKINQDGIIGDGTIQRISLLSRSEYPGYAKQNELLPGTWITVFFGGEIPAIITAEITNLEEDMIEIKTYPDNETLYLNFDYKGIPEDIGIETIQIRTSPPPSFEKTVINEEESGENQDDNQDDNQNKQEEREREITADEKEIVKSTFPTNIPLKSIIQESDIVFGEEEMGTIVQSIDVPEERKRFSIEIQTNDLLDDLLSTLPNIERTPNNITELHTMIERFKQLRQSFSLFDSNGNIQTFVTRGADWKPLVEELLHLKTKLFWILPVVKNTKKIYSDQENKESESTDVDILSLTEDINAIKDIVQQYYSNHLPDEQNKYTHLYEELNPYFTPFEVIHHANTNNIVYETPVQNEILAVVSNMDSFLSTVFVEKENKENDKKEKRFLLTQYNTGLTHLHSVPDFNGGRLYSERGLLTPNDTLSVKSFLTLPEPFIRYSRINLPGTFLLDKANLNTVSLSYWKLLNNKTSVKTTEIENNQSENISQTQVTFDELQHFIISKTEEDDATIPAPFFLGKIIPKTKTLLKMMEKYIHGKLSVKHVLDYMEPFLIYPEDLTYQQYIEITRFIDNKISSYNKNFIERERIFTVLKNIKRFYTLSPMVQAIYNNFDTQYSLQEAVFEKYGYQPPKNEIVITNSELLTNITVNDFGYLYNTAVGLKNIGLMFSENLMNIFEEEEKENKKNNEEESKENICKKYELAKKYNSLEELNADNGVDIYFDRQYDTTHYSMLDDYEKDMFSMSADDFATFLIGKLKTELKLNDMDAEYLAETLVSGIKKVTEGQYAVLFREPTEDGETGEILKAEYYRRDNNQWVLDNLVDSTTFITDSNLLCNLQKNCIEKQDSCVSIPMNRSSLVEKNWKSVFNEFDKNYEISREALESKLKMYYEYYGQFFERWQKTKQAQRLQYNNEQYKIGIKMSDTMQDIVVSPYAKLLDTISGQGNFIKKQYDIVRFKNQFTREGMEGRIGPNGEEENGFWFYCRQTNVKLLPAFLYELAHVFINDNENYNQKVDILITQIGKKSEDGDCWVDKHSGRVIKMIDFSVDEGYDDGFQVVTREVLEQDFGDSLNSVVTLKTETVEGKIILNIIDVLSVNMGIQMDSQKDFIKRNAIIAFSQKLPSETFYKKKIQELAKKGKVNQPSYNDLYHSTLLYITLGMFMIAVQVNIPSMKSRRTFPGCVRSFTGYPIEGAGDESFLQYLACVTKKIKSNVEPYHVLLKASEEFIAKKIRDVIQEPLWTMPDIVSKVQEKIEYLVSNAEEEKHDIPEEYNINKWRLFLPPLIPFRIRNLNNITNEFKSSLKLDLDEGSSGQREKLMVIESKIIFFSLALQECIQNIVYKKKLIMANSLKEPFVENACCNEEGRLSALRYFIKEDGSIETYNKTVRNLEEILLDIRNLTQAPFLFCRESSKLIYPPLSNDFNEETIYRAFIVLCRFNSLLPIHENLIPVCNNKPEFNVNKFSFKETVIKLKEEGRNYNNESLLRLMQIVNRNHRIDVQMDKYVENSFEIVQDVFVKINQMDLSTTQQEQNQDFTKDGDLDSENVEEKEENIISAEFMHIMQPLLENDNTETISQETVRNIKNYLSRSNDSMRITIHEFIRKNQTMTGKKYKNEIDLIDLFEWNQENKNKNKIYDEDGANVFQFTKTYIKNFAEVFPHIILNKNEKNDIMMRHWDLSIIHYNNINKIISGYYEDLGAFYDNTSLEVVLNAIEERCKIVVELAMVTPYFPKKKEEEQESYTFDKRMSKLLLEYYFLLIINQYIELTNNNQLFFDYSVREDTTVNDIFTTETSRDERNKKMIVALDTEKDLTLEGNKKQLQKKVANLLFVFLRMMNQDKKIVDKSFDNIMDKVYRIKEREKNMVTDRLKAFSDEERRVDSILKLNKLGLWNKGLQKGLKKYVKTNYDDERLFIENLHQIEKNVRDANPNADSGDIDSFLEDEIENRDTEQQIEDEVYDMSDMNEDYTDGMYDPDDTDNLADTDNDFYLQEDL